MTNYILHNDGTDGIGNWKGFLADAAVAVDGDFFKISDLKPGTNGTQTQVWYDSANFQAATGTTYQVGFYVEAFDSSGNPAPAGAVGVHSMIRYFGTPLGDSTMGTDAPINIVSDLPTGDFTATFSPSYNHTSARLIVRAYAPSQADGSLGPYTVKIRNVYMGTNGGYEPFGGQQPENVAPSVSAGSDATITLPATVSLNGTVSDDGLPTATMTTTWSKVSGPGTVAFTNANAVDTTASFSTYGVYTLRLTATDGDLTTSDDVQIIVNAATPSGESNRIQHPNAVVSGALSAWPATTTSTMTADGTYFSLNPKQGQSSASGSITYTPFIPVAAGETLTFMIDVDRNVTWGSVSAVFAFYSAPSTGSGIPGNITYGLPSEGDDSDTRGVFTVNVPSGALYVRLNLQANVSGGQTWDNQPSVTFTNLYLGTYTAATGGATPEPPPAEVVTGLEIKLEIEDTTQEANLVTNPSGTTGAWGWVSNDSKNIVSTTGTGDWTFLRFTSLSGLATHYLSEAFPIDTDLTYTGIRMLFGGHSEGAKVRIRVDWLDINKAVLGSTSQETVTVSAGAEYNRVVSGYSPNTEYARIRIDQYHVADNAWVNDFFEFREATALQSDVFEDVDDLQDWQSETNVWLNIIEPTHEITIERDSVDVGLMTAAVLKDEYDPAAGGIVQPGSAVRVSVVSNDVWTSIFQGTINNVQTTYPRNAETRIFMTASDAMSLLSNQNESRGVATIANLPALLADKGVAWSANGNANQVGTVPQVSSNDSASVFDQMVITRDSDKGYVWVNANNVVQMWNRSLMPTAPVVEYTDVPNAGALYDSYSEIDMGFDTRRTINVVEINYLRYFQNEELEWATEEIKYGPYVDADSLKKWGAYKSTFTIHGITESEANMQAFANEVLSKNATPTVKVNSIRVPVKDERGRAHAAAVDLYTMVGVKYGNKFDGDLRVVSIKHDIAPGKWTAEYTFESGDSVAVPVWTPSSNG